MGQSAALVHLAHPSTPLHNTCKLAGFAWPAVQTWHLAISLPAPCNSGRVRVALLFCCCGRWQYQEVNSEWQLYGPMDVASWSRWDMP